jgi:hypothetical protein
MVYRRYTEVLLSQESRDLMDKHFLGWHAPDPWPDSTKGVYGTYLVHGGDLYDPDGDPSREMHGCAMQFPIQVEAVVLINSSTTLSQYQCTMLREAFENAWVAH